MHDIIILRLVTLLLLVAPSLAMAQVTPNREDAMNFPSKHAWNLFLLVNHPAKDPKLGRGQPDLSKSIGTPGTTSVWETWRLTGTEVCLKDGDEPPQDFNDNSLAGSPVTGKVPEPPKHVLLAKLAAAGSPFVNQRMVLQPLFDFDGGVFRGEGAFGESRMNKATYDFVWTNKIYSLKGLRAFAAKKAPLSFPVDSMEVKAAWIELTPELLQGGAEKRYYTADYDGKKYGLSSLHIITKDVPNWFWCTFHHKESPNTGVETPDTFGQPSQLKGTVWENYKLGGTQTEFVTTIGQPTLLSDPYIEKGFEKSSCISCHARASIDDTGRGLSSKAVVGAPNPADFTKDGKPIFQTDFLFSLPFRAH